jgi:hypothetical protein
MGANFAVHPDYNSHTGATMSYVDGNGAVQSISRKQKLNTKSSTESKLVGVDNIDINSNILYQDNKSDTLLETNLWEEGPSTEYVSFLPHQSS